GAIATQSLVNRQYGPDGLDLLKKGRQPKEVIEQLTEKDEGRDYRQLAVLSADGRVAAYTGAKCIREADHIVGEGFSVQANMMARNGVCEAMAAAFQTKTQTDSVQARPSLARRILDALKAAETLGGDIRGKQSAAIITANTTSKGRIADEYRVDLRVDDHPEPLEELERLLNLHDGYECLEEGDAKLGIGDFEGAMNDYRSALKTAPENREMRYWKAVALLQANYREEAFHLLEELIREHPGWLDLLHRLEEAELALFPEELLGELDRRFGL
ncbi:MAG: DUF1028 domain-containing protein, partial [Spirochaetia bacterium]|nr:DUF1028 domain-containing protein [Spirochaetia bacterium]